MGQGVSSETTSLKEDLGDLSLEYKYTDLYAATGGFSPECCLGSGAAGSVYRGSLPGGTEVAVKVIADAAGLDGFLDEVKMLSRFRHPNLVTLMGWGQRGKEKYLVYELLSGGDVSKKLERSKRGEVPFPWEQRLKVAMGAASGLAYMATWTPKAFHRDIKPANILLDAYGVAKVADFGLSGMVQDKGNHLTVAQVAGTPGYACPVYIKEKRVTEESEVYSFGTVLLELLVNEPPALAAPNGQIVFPLLQRLQPSAPGAHERVMNSLDSAAGWPRTLAVPMAKLALDCVIVPERRPSFAKIADVLRSHHSKFCSQTGPAAMQASPSLRAPPPPGGGGGWQQAQRMAPGHCAGGAVPGPNGKQEYGYPPREPPAAPLQQQQRQEPGVAPQQAFGKRFSENANGPINGRKSRDVYIDKSPQRAVSGGASSSNSKARYRGNPREDSAEDGKQLAEIILECVHGDGVDVSSMPPSQRALVFIIKPGQTRLRETLGRNYQEKFLDRLVLREQQGYISRSHCEFLWEAPDATPRFRKLSMNPMLIDEKLVLDGEAVQLTSGTQLGFIQTRENGKACFLSMKVLLRDVANVKANGPHPAIAAVGSAPPAPSRTLSNSKNKPVPALDRAPSQGGMFLECVYAAGITVAELPWEDRSIALQIDVPVDVGRQHQVNFFEHLLQREQTWLKFISRSHCRLTLERSSGHNGGKASRVDEQFKSPSPPTTLLIENLSSNVIFVGNRGLDKGHSGWLADDGAMLEFAAAPHGPPERPENIVKFLQFRLRRPPSGGHRNYS